MSRIVALKIQLMCLIVIRKTALKSDHFHYPPIKLPRQNDGSGPRPFLYNTLCIQMVKSYCVKQKKQRECVPGSETTVRAKNGRVMMKCKCAECGITKQNLSEGKQVALVGC